MKILSLVVVLLSILKLVFTEEDAIDLGSDLENTTPADDGQFVREPRSFFKRHRGGLFGHHRGHHNGCGQCHQPNCYGNGGCGYNQGYGGGYGAGGGSYGGGYGSGYGGSGYGSSGYGSSYGGNSAYNYNSRPSYGGKGYYKPGLSYTIGDSTKTSGYAPSYSSGSSATYTKPGSDTSSYYSGSTSKSPYSAGSYAYGTNSEKKDSYLSGGVSSYTKTDSKLYEKNDYDKTPHNQKGSQLNGAYTKESCEEDDGDSSSSSSEEDNFSHSNKKTSGNRKHECKKNHFHNVPYQPVAYIPQIPAISMVHPIAYGYNTPLYSNSGYYPQMYSTMYGYDNNSGKQSSQAPTPAVMYPPPVSAYSLPAATYPYPIAPATYPISPAAYPVSPSVYGAPQSGYAAPTTSYSGSPTPSSDYSKPSTYGISAPASPPYSSCSDSSSQQYVPTYTVTSFDVHTYTSPYQPHKAEYPPTSMLGKSNPNPLSTGGPYGYEPNVFAGQVGNARASVASEETKDAEEDIKKKFTQLLYNN